MSHRRMSMALLSIGWWTVGCKAESGGNSEERSRKWNRTDRSYGTYMTYQGGNGAGQKPASSNGFPQRLSAGLGFGALAFDLDLEELGVAAAGGEELLVGADLDDAALFE